MRASLPSPPLPLTFEQAQKLPVAKNASPTRHTVATYGGGGGSVSKADPKIGLGLHIEQMLRDPLTDHPRVSFRELLQNLVDAAVEANDASSYTGLEIVEGKRNNATEEVICFHNGKVRLAEIVAVDQTTQAAPAYFQYGYEANVDAVPTKAGEYGTLSFINYGVVIGSIAQVLAIGNSSKHGVDNQVGRHGEGLKRAALGLLAAGDGMSIYFATDGFTSPPVAQVLSFYIGADVGSTTHGVLCAKRISVKAEEIGASVDTKMRFHVTVYYPKRPYRAAYTSKEIFPKPIHYGFKMSNYLLDRALIRNRHFTGADHGFVIPNGSGRVYVWNFHVFDDPNWLAFSYNLFAIIGRDRDNMNHKVLVEYIAGIWNEVFANPKEAALQNAFYDKMFPEPNNKWLETQALDQLTLRAHEVITGIFRVKNPTAIFALKPKEAKGMKHRRIAVQGSLEVSSPILYNMLTGRHKARFPTAFEWLEKQKAKLISSVVATNVPQNVVEIMPLNVIFKVGQDCVLDSTRTQSNDVHVNWSKLSILKTTEEILNTLICHILPAELKEKFDVTPMLRQTKIRVPSPVLTAAAAAVPGKEDTEQQQAAPSQPSSRKRVEPPAEEVECPYPPIVGKKWQRMWVVTENKDK